ncbi:MAG: response regulator [Anaerolineae bacterium]|nr:response regulator [Anaerolineae bacterium]MEB2287552.1 response regulator [Anaerolineae bacterium]
MQTHKPLVLVADDEANAVLLLHRVLEREGFAVESARDGMATLEKARALKPDLILLDVQMPRLNGFEVTARLREDPETARIPVIFVTAAAREPSDVAHGLQLGADDYIRKPYDYHELVARAISKMRARQLEDRLQRRNAELEALVRVGAEFNQRLALPELTRRMINIITQEFSARFVELYLFDEDGQPVLCRDTLREEIGQAEALALLEHPGSVAGRVYRTGEPFLQAELADEFDLLYAQGLRSALAVPLHHHNRLLGILAVAHSEPDFYGESKLRMARSIGEQAALAVRNAQLYAALHSYAQNLEAMVEERTDELRSAQAALLQSEKLAALGRLAAGIAHEVNNPLQPILNTLEVAIEDIASGQPVDPQSLRIAEQEVQRIKGIVTRLLGFARPSAGEMIPVDLSALVEEVILLTQKQLEHMDIRVSSSLQDVPPVLGTPAQLKQVLLNLVLNAAQSMSGGGDLSIEVYPEGQGVALAVLDTGIGIEDESVGRIFEPFYSTKSEGTGLGLSVTYGIVQGHGGTIHVRSQTGEGSQFTVWLPCQRSNSAPPPA